MIAMYCLFSNAPISQHSWTKNFKVSSLLLMRSIIESFWFLGAYPASSTHSTVSMNSMSIFTPRVCRVSFGMWGRISCQRLYASPSILSAGRSIVDTLRWGGGLIHRIFMMRIQLRHTFADVTSLENLLSAWAEFVKGKRNRKDVQVFARNLMDNLSSLHEGLCNHTYRHGGYHAFFISDPKPRSIHKANVRDRVVHRALYRILYPFFEDAFAYDSYSCQKEKGVHKALLRFRKLCRGASRNNTRTCYALKCDIQKFFASVDQNTLLGILSLYIPDQRILVLVRAIIASFHSTTLGKGLPLGNLTSQLFVNIYMNEFDRFVKHTLKARYYVRYADDFVLLSHDKTWLEHQVPHIASCLHNLLALSLHPHKVHIRSLASGVDFLGWVHFPNHRVLRTATARRMKKRIIDNPVSETMQSYVGLLSHGNTNGLKREILDLYGLLSDKYGSGLT